MVQINLTIFTQILIHTFKEKQRTLSCVYMKVGNACQKDIQSITNNKSLKEEKKIPVSFFRMGEEKVVMCVNTLFFNKLLNLFPQVWHNFANKKFM